MSIALDASGQLALAWYEPSRDGRYVAFGTYRAGDENTSLPRARDARQAAWLADEITGRVDPVDWLDDGEHFVVRRLADAANPYSGQIALHRLGGASAARPGAVRAVHRRTARDDLGSVRRSSMRGGRWLVVAYYTGTDSNDLWCYDLRPVARGRECSRAATSRRRRPRSRQASSTAIAFTR